MKYLIFYFLLSLSTFSGFSQNNIVIIKTVQSNTTISINNELIDNSIRELKNILKGNSNFKFTLDGFDENIELWIHLDNNDSVVINVDFSHNIARPTYYKRSPYSKNNKKRKVFYRVEDMPIFLGEDKTLENYISRSVVEKKSSIGKNIIGKIIVQFTINKKGATSTVTLLKGLGNELDAIAVEIIKNMPKWEPGKQHGKPVNVLFTVPVKF